MHSGFTIAGIVLGALTGFKAPMHSRQIPAGVDISIEILIGVSLLFTVPTTPTPWPAGIGGVFIGHAIGAFVRMFTKP